MRGRFITFEGVEGAGKSTLIAALREALDARGLEYLATREPGGEPASERMRELLLHRHELAITPVAEMLLMFAARANLLTHVVRPALAAGTLVLCDRFTDATYAYQGAGRELGFDAVAAVERVVHPDLQPDCTVLLDLPVAEGLARKQADTPDRIEQERLAFFERVREGYRRRVRACPARFLVLDARQPPAELAERALARVLAELGMASGA
jgi:dTMP kinase